MEEVAPEAAAWVELDSCLTAVGDGGPGAGRPKGSGGQQVTSVTLNRYHHQVLFSHTQQKLGKDG